MASVYNLEPPPTAKCILHTTSGPITLSLFAQQCPLASRSFLQHLLDGYYTSTSFHRLIPNFILQGGDPTGTGQGGESAFPTGATFKGGKDGRTEEIFDAGGGFKMEVHSRLKFNRRGLLGMSSEENGGQFFFTLGATPELQGKNTLFGRVEGETIYNLMRMGEAELEEVQGSERPMYPTTITGAEVLVNPFEGMVKRDSGPKVAMAEERGGKKVGKKGKKNRTLLSFGGEEGEGEEGGEEMVIVKDKFNTKLIRADDSASAKGNQNGVGGLTKPTDRKSEKAVRRRLTRSPSPPRLVEPNRELQLPLPDNEKPSRSPSISPEPAPVRSMTSTLEKTNAQIAELKASMKRNVQTGPIVETKKKSTLEQMIPENAMRGRKRKHGVKDEEETMDFLNAFRTKLEKAAPETKSTRSFVDQLQTDGKLHDTGSARVDAQQTIADDNGDEAEVCDLHFIANCQSCKAWEQDVGADADDKDEGGEGWMSHALSFEKDRLGKDLNWKKKNEEELVVIDPREKAKDLREEARAKKLARMGKGGMGPEWGRGREPRKAA